MKAGLTAFLVFVSGWTPAFAYHSGLEANFTASFREDYSRAQEQLFNKGMLAPMLELIPKYTSPAEKAELELTVGLAYNQRTGLVDPQKAIEHFTLATQHPLPERALLDILSWRGNSHEQLKQHKQALQDYLRGLVLCSYYDWSRGWPKIEHSAHPIYMNSTDPNNATRSRDYMDYRNKNDYIRHILSKKYFLIESVKRVQNAGSINDADLLAALADITPDPYARQKIAAALKGENKRPRP